MAKFLKSSIFSGKYKLAPSVNERLSVLLRSRRNGESSFLLAVYICRFNAGPKRLQHTFPLDRRALALRPEMVAAGMTVDKIRGAIETLQEIDFVEPVVDENDALYQSEKSNTYTDKPNGGKVWRKAIQYRFTSWFWEKFAYIAFRMTKSPISRRDINKNISNAREAPVLGEKGSSTAAAKGPAKGFKTGAVRFMGDLFAKPPSVLRDARQAVKSPLKGQKPPVEANPVLEAILARLGGHVAGKAATEPVVKTALH